MNTEASYPMNNIVAPGDHDALCGRGGHTIHWSGNIQFRALVENHRGSYHSASRVEKGKVVAEVVKMWRGLSPPGRFLTLTDPKMGDASPWKDIGDKAAQKKTAKRLRESLPEGTTSSTTTTLTATISASISDSSNSGSDEEEQQQPRRSSNTTTTHVNRASQVRRVSNDTSMERAAKRVRLEFNNLMTLPSFEDQFSQVSGDDNLEQQLMAEGDLDLDSLFEICPEDMPALDSIVTTSSSSSTNMMDQFHESWLSMADPSSFNAHQGGSFMQDVAGSIPSAAALTEGILFDF